LGRDTSFFAELLHAGSHLQSLEAIRKGQVHGAALDSNVLFQKPREGLRVIESWGPFPIQPVIVRAGVEEALKARVAGALLAMHEHHDLSPFGFARFAAVTAADYA
jgi:ABC-type phosphate/phosphonate transport system substrate-binding protein